MLLKKVKHQTCACRGTSQGFVGSVCSRLVILIKTLIAFEFVLILRMCFFSGVSREWKIYFNVYRKSTQVDISKCNRIFRLLEKYMMIVNVLIINHYRKRPS